MRRDIFHICIALLCLIVGLVVAGASESLVGVTGFALACFVAVKLLPQKYRNWHYLAVGALTVIIWVPFAALILSQGYWANFNEDSPAPILRAEALPVQFSDPGSPCDRRSNDPSEHPIVWAGTLDEKAVFKPQINYEAKFNRPTIVPVSVLVDSSGYVVWSQSISGPGEYRILARNVACQARFRPSFVDGPTFLINGILTFRFEPTPSERR